MCVCRQSGRGGRQGAKAPVNMRAEALKVRRFLLFRIFFDDFCAALCEVGVCSLTLLDRTVPEEEEPLSILPISTILPELLDEEELLTSQPSIVSHALSLSSIYYAFFTRLTHCLSDLL